MNNNDVLRQLRYALDLPDKKMLECFSNCGIKINQEDLIAFLKKEDEEGFTECPNHLLSKFLDGLIIEKRGYREPKPNIKLPDPHKLNNNGILKKIRIALALQEPDMLEIFSLGGFNINRAELSALYRSSDHRNFKPAGDQLLRYFLRGLIRRLR